MSTLQLNCPPMATAIPVPLRTKSFKSYPSLEHRTPTDVGNEESLCKNVAAALQRPREPLSEYQIQQLMKQGFTRGLAQSMNDMLNIFALRIWIVDNSGSMSHTDGNRMISLPGSNHKIKMVQCSRWEEISDCIEYHIRLSGLLQAPTQFRLLNNPGVHVGDQRFSIATDSQSDSLSRYHADDEVAKATAILRRTRPHGLTPLTNHVLEIASELEQMSPLLRRLGRKVAIVIATDGLPTSCGDCNLNSTNAKQDFIQALHMLERFPVWIVIRLCTDDDEVVQFYNDLDDQLELSIEVLDDFRAEALEVTGENPWVNYALPLHRVREMGYHDRVFDLLDERPLTKLESQDFLRILLGSESLDGAPDPSLDWKGFTKEVSRLLEKESLQYDPRWGKMKPWVCARKFDRAFRQRQFLCFL